VSLGDFLAIALSWAAFETWYALPTRRKLRNTKRMRALAAMVNFCPDFATWREMRAEDERRRRAS